MIRSRIVAAIVIPRVACEFASWDLPQGTLCTNRTTASHHAGSAPVRSADAIQEDAPRRPGSDAIEE